jgi:hypothetical protein
MDENDALTAPAPTGVASVHSLWAARHRARHASGRAAGTARRWPARARESASRALVAIRGGEAP